ncbi:hypothetical protein LDG_8447 [Legionella drancourtii LLAP12]|uniref:Uncharacterized protein n=1 Tax=Legionella drancourtii LLAP12 TaxID=658187 RepID=G9ET18_9GAMM|nr:hypothetical protein LDG_8447 [Legionella drancourtii LLAP12]
MLKCAKGTIHQEQATARTGKQLHLCAIVPIFFGYRHHV